MKKSYDFSKGKRGPVIKGPRGKTRITIRIDDDILDWFRSQVQVAGGGNYQTMINDALREFVNTRKEDLEETLRRIVREDDLKMLENVIQTGASKGMHMMDTSIARLVREDRVDKKVADFYTEAFLKTKRYN